MKQLVVINPSNAKLGIAIRVQFYDHIQYEEPLMKLKGCSIILRSSEPDGMIIDNENGIFIFVAKEWTDQLEILGEL